MSDQVHWFVGIDWASEQHRVCLLDAEGKCVAERDVAHGGAELSEMCAWLLEKTGAEPAEIAVAIETPHGPVVEALLERGFKVFAINPKQLDRFRDRFSVAGAKDDSRDAHVLAGSLRTDRHAFRRLAVDDPLVVELREWSRIYDELEQEQNRLTNRMRGQLWRYYPQAIELSDDLAVEWFLDVWQQVPTPAKAARSARIRSHASSRAIAFVAWMRQRSCASCAGRRSRWRLEQPKPQPPISVPSRSGCGSSISRSRRLSAGWTSSAPPSRPLRRARRGRSASSATSRSCVPVQGSEGSTSPRCSPRPASLCGGEITTC